MDYLRSITRSIKIEIDMQVNEVNGVLLKLKEAASNVQDELELKQQAHSFLSKRNNMNMCIQMYVSVENI